MKRALLTLSGFVFALLLCNYAVAQNTKTWLGASGTLWSTAANWSPSGVPVSTDTVIFSNSNPCDMDVNPVIASLRAQGVGGNIIASGGFRTMTINNAADASPVFSVAAGATLSMGNGGFGITFSTYGASGPNNAQIAGTLNLAFATTWIVNDAPILNTTVVDITGTINVTSVHTGNLFNNSSTTTVRFQSGSNLLWARNGGASIPAADYQSGSTITITGVTNAMATFSGGANYNGLIIWNCAGQTISGASAIILPSTAAIMDSIRIINTNTGTVRLSTNPTGYTIGHLEVQGGTIELSAATGANRTGSITTDLKISGGTVYGNATYAGDATNAYAMTVTVNGNIIISGGTLDLTNRPIGLLPGGASTFSIKGNIVQTGGLITATSSFGSQNQLYLNGTAVQNVQVNNFTGTVSLAIGNSTNGASLQSNLTLPSALNLFSGGFIQLNNFDLSTAAGLLFSSGNGKAVTNGTGTLKVTGLLASASQTFPVAPSAATYNPVTIVPSAGAVSPNTYAVRVEAGLNPTIAYPLYAVNRTWTVTATTAPGAPVSTTLQYSNTDGTSGFTYGDNVDHGVYFGGGWNVDATNIVPVFSSPNYTVTSNVVSLSSGIGLPMVIGNLGSILNSRRTIDLTVQKQNAKAQLNWTINSTASIKEVIIERSSNGRSFEQLATVPTLINMYTDNNLLAGTNYYRIKVTDAAGKISYSTIAAIINSDAGFDIVSLLPNIVRTEMQLNVTAAKKTKLNVVITDMAGRPAGRQLYSLAAGSNLFDINAAALASGMYYLTATTAEGEIKTIRFIKQ